MGVSQHILPSLALTCAIAQAAPARGANVPVPAAPPASAAPPDGASADAGGSGDADDADVDKTDSARKVTRLAVYQLSTVAVDERIVDVLTNSVVGELRKLERITVVGMDEIKAMLDLEAQKQLTGCSDVSCLSEIGEALGVDGVIIGSVAVVGEALSFGLKHIDQRNAQTLGQYDTRIDGTDPANVLAAIGPAIATLFPDVPLKPGTTRGVPPEVALRIHPPPLDPWVFWVAAVPAGAAVLAGAGFTTWNLIAWSSAQEKANASVKGDPVSGRELNADIGAVQVSFVALTISYGAALAAGIGAGVVALFTDWDNVRGAE